MRTSVHRLLYQADVIEIKQDSSRLRAMRTSVHRLLYQADVIEIKEDSSRVKLLW